MVVVGAVAIAVAFSVACDPPPIGEEPLPDEAATESPQQSSTPAASHTATTRAAPLPTQEDAGPDVAAPPPPPPCTEAGAIQAKGHCYFALSAPQTFDAALASCNSAGAHLVTLSDAVEQTTVATLLPTDERWIGLRRPTGSPVADASYVWTTGEPRSFQNWSTSKNEPDGSCPTCNNGAIPAECGRMIATGEWADDSCSAQHPALCERD
jgi:hypothetical protein